MSAEETKIKRNVNDFAFAYDTTYVISAEHPQCEALIFSNLEGILPQEKGKGNAGRKKRLYADLITCFDIETTKLDRYKQSFMYVWQWQIGPKLTVIGRTWDSFIETQKIVKRVIPEGCHVVIFDHNLSYEFQFLRGIYPFDTEEVFCTRPHKVLKCDMWETFEFRCSMLHSNMSLDLYTKKMDVAHKKLKGELDYSKKRYPWTPLNVKKELPYMINDVLGLYEAIKKEMDLDGDNLNTFPLTSTGYVRRRVKEAMREISRTFITNMLPDFDTLQQLEAAFRGGDTHANRITANKIIKNVHSVDRSSSYPDVQINCKFPISKFIRVPKKEESIDKVISLMQSGKAVLFDCEIYDLKLKDDRWPNPYLSKHKCYIEEKDKKSGQMIKHYGHVINGRFDNGRLLSSDYFCTTLTDVDLKIILETYDCSIKAHNIKFARYGYLPDVYRNVINDLYKEKTRLKGETGDLAVLYNKLKAMLNAVYGMSAQHVIPISYIYEGADFKIKDVDQIVELNKAYRGAFSSYAWGVWTTAWARYRLYEGQRIVYDAIDDSGRKTATLIYWDTDSLKYTGIADFSAYNDQRKKDSFINGAFGKDANGEVHYMGVFEEEPDNFGTRFKTLGAKKYVYDGVDGKLHITIAGVNKQKGAQELAEAGGIEAFNADGDNPFVFRKGGGTTLIYNDLKKPVHLTVQKRDLVITSNVLIEYDYYTLGVQADYEKLLDDYQYDYEFVQDVS